MTKLQRYLAEEIAVDHADGIIGRREALRRLGLLGLGLTAASALLAACAKDDTSPVAPTPTPSASPTTPDPSPSGAVPTEEITFPGPNGRLMGAFAPATAPRGGVLVIHENRGLTDHIRSVAGRLAGAGYSSLALDLLSEEGGTAALGGDGEATAALNAAPESRFVADMRAALTELERRAGAGAKLGQIGFCFGGAMTWLMLHAGERRLAAAAPFYGTTPEDPDFSGSEAAVLAVYAERDSRVNATRDEAAAALRRAGLEHRVNTYPGVDHAFFNETGARYDATQARQAFRDVLAWFGTHLG